MESVWNNGESIKEFPSLSGEIKTDVLIIGGGMCGILCAYFLKQAGVDCVVSEADRVCGGVTRGTTAKITLQHGLIYQKIIKKYGKDIASLYLESQKKALEAFQKMAQSIDCDFELCDSFVYSTSDREIIQKEVEAFGKIGQKAEFTTKTELPFDVSGAVKLENQAKFHPLKFISSITNDLPIYEKTKITELVPGGALTDNGKIRAKKIIVATHFPFINKHGAYFLKMYQHRSFVLAIKNVPDFKGMYVDEAQEGLSFRSHKGLLLIGGGAHRTGCRGEGFAGPERFVQKYYPDAEETNRWATQDCMTLDSIPYIGQYSKSTPDLFVATGFNKWGMTSSMVSAQILSDLVQGRKNKYTEVYAPSRSVLHPQLAVNVFEAVKGLLTPTAPRCPHMGCALKYNKQEHSWDCACHGSRFDENGKVINNPATDDKKDI